MDPNVMRKTELMGIPALYSSSHVSETAIQWVQESSERSCLVGGFPPKSGVFSVPVEFSSQRANFWTTNC